MFARRGAVDRPVNQEDYRSSEPLIYFEAIKTSNTEDD